MSSAKIHSDLAAAEIISGPPVYVRRKFYYTGHATTTYSVDQASTIIDLIGSKTRSDHCLPFAVRLVEGGEMISIAEGNIFNNYRRNTVANKFFMMCHYLRNVLYTNLIILFLIFRR